MAKTQHKTSNKQGSGARLLGVKDAAAWLGISQWTLRERIWAGDVPFIRFPGCRKQLLDVRDLENMIQENKMVTGY